MGSKPDREERRLVREGGEWRSAQRGDREVFEAVSIAELDELYLPCTGGGWSVTERGADDTVVESWGEDRCGTCVNCVFAGKIW